MLQSEMLIEAPNWSPDGRWLLVNGEGRLYRVPLDAPALEMIDTGLATACNNDHGISPDGSEIVLSDKTETGESCIYTLPVAGGTPERITDTVPSYWHGWSPDGKTLAYVGRRDGAYNLYTMDIAARTETLLTSGGHNDGPDYSPDGAWIWFNSDRSGASQIWRIRPDGRDLEMMTQDDWTSWFPHPDPTGAHVLYLNYAPNTAQHPRDRDVSLWLMRTSGGGHRKLMDLFGGQGTINVPCWSPDGRHFAFMRYAPED